MSPSEGGSVKYDSKPRGAESELVTRKPHQLPWAHFPTVYYPGCPPTTPKSRKILFTKIKENYKCYLFGKSFYFSVSQSMGHVPPSFRWHLSVTLNDTESHDKKSSSPFFPFSQVKQRVLIKC